jgi:beta-glucanase (GH16 family)
MKRLASTDTRKLIEINPRLMDFLTDSVAPITISLADVTVLPTATEARLKLSLTGTPRDTVIGSFQTRNGTGTNQGTNYIASNGGFVFQPGDKTEQEIVIQLRGNNAEGKTIEVYLKAITGASVAKSSGWITFSLNPQQVVSSGYKLAFQTDFVNGFQFSDTGFLPDGTPCWQSRPAHGRTQDGNKELGLYADPVVFPGTNPFPVVNGKRVLRSEKLTTPLTYSNRSWNYTASMITSRTLKTAAPGSRVECRLAMPVLGKRGAWPAFWLMPTNGAWPPEIDMMEWPINSNANAWTYYSTQHWTSTTNSPLALGYPLDIRLLGIPNVTDLTDFHVYGISITDEEIIFDFDGVKTIVMENRSPGQSWYILLNIAMGGSWPGSPTSDAVFPCDMILDWLKIYEPV